MTGRWNIHPKRLNDPELYEKMREGWEPFAVTTDKDNNDWVYLRFNWNAEHQEAGR